MNTKSADADAGIVTIKVVDGVAVLTFDVPGEKQNTLSEHSARALQAAFERVENDAAIHGAVLISGKPDFIAGADISMLQACTSAEQVEKLSRDMQAQLERMEKSKKPVVAAIDGSCLGGGLEVALACHWRIASDSPKTQLGLPEVMLGLLPGGGGTQRLPRLIGLQGALDMLLTGKNIRAVKAKRMGLVDQVTLPYGLEEAAISSCKRLIAGELKRPDRKDKLDPQGKVMEAALEDNGAGRAIVFHQARATVMEKTLGLYPAPLAILDVVEAGYNHGITAGFETESRRFGLLAMTPESHALMHLFFGQTALKKNRYGKPKKPLTTVGVLGAGLMGSGIADVTANKGIRTFMKDVSPESLARGQKAIWQGLDKRVRSAERGARSQLAFERERIAANVVPKTDYQGFASVDLVIEAVFEDLAVKHKVLRECEAHLRDDAVFASNTSALPIAQIAAASKRPENVVGMHYFSPVQKMPLLEVVVTDQTSKHAASLAVEAGILQGKTVIVVKDGPGFYTTRILGPVMEEAAVLALEGVDLHAIDLLMRQAGFPVGPITLLDEVGIDVAAHVAKDMAPFFEKRFGKRDSSALDAMVKQGFLGRKSSKGFFLYGKEQPRDALSRAKSFASHLPMVGDRLGELVGGKGKPLNPGALEILSAHGTKHGSKKSYDKKELQDRVLLRMVNEAVQCLQEGVLDNAVDGDIGAVFGLGFPPMTGGPFRYVDTVGAGVVVATLERFASKMGPRFTPCALLVEQAKTGRKFHKGS